MPNTTVVRGPLDAVKIFQINITPTSVPAQNSNEQTFTVIGINPGDYINLGSAAAQTAGIVVGSCRITAPNTLAVQFVNVSGAAVVPVSGTYGCVWGTPEYLPLDTNAL